MKAADAMTTDVISVRPSQSVQEVASILLAHRISAVPAVSEDGDQLVGIVSEGDLIRRREAGTDRRRSWWLELLAAPDTAEDYVKTHGRRVADVMTSNVITVGPDTPLSDIADLIEKEGIKRVPVVDDGRLVGIVSRANLLQALAASKDEMSVETTADDAAIRNDILRRIEAEPWKPILLNVIVHDGTVELWGFADSASQKKAARIVAESAPGVRAVQDNIILRSSLKVGD
jgi:CBS domain-containing protein